METWKEMKKVRKKNTLVKMLLFGVMILLVCCLVGGYVLFSNFGASFQLYPIYCSQTDVFGYPYDSALSDKMGECAYEGDMFPVVYYYPTTSEHPEGVKIEVYGAQECSYRRASVSFGEFPGGEVGQLFLFEEDPYEVNLSCDSGVDGVGPFEFRVPIDLDLIFKEDYQSA